MQKPFSGTQSILGKRVIQDAPLARMLCNIRCTPSICPVDIAWPALVVFSLLDVSSRTKHLLERGWGIDQDAVWAISEFRPYGDN